MLSIMRRKAGSWMIKVILGAIVVVFVFWGVGSFRNQRDASIARVNGQAISHDEYNQAYNRLIEGLTRQFGNSLNDEMIKMMNVKQQALDQTINKKLLLEEAGRLSIRVSDEELADSILQYPAFQAENGNFDKRLYEHALAQNHLTVKGFETLQREQLLLGKLHAFLAGGIETTEEEAKAWYDWEKSQVKLTYALFDPATVPEVDPADAELTAFYDAHKEQYKTEPMRKVAYLSFSPDEFLSGVTVSDNDVADYYEANISQFETPKTVEARHVLFRLAQNADPAAVEAAFKKAEEVQQKALGGADFAELAKAYSEDPSKGNGGLLGEFKKEDMVPAFSDKAFSMTPGQISEPVRTPFGWHVIKVEKVNESSVSPLEKAGPEIRAKLIGEQARSAAYDAAEAAYDAALGDTDLAKIGQSIQRSLAETDFFTSAGPEGLPEKETFAGAAFALSDKEISDVVETDKSFYVMQLLEEKPSRIPELAEVRVAVIRDLKEKRRDDQAKADAEAFLGGLKADPALFADKAKEAGKPAVATEFFNRNAAVPTLGNEREMNRAAFELSAKSPLSGEPVKTKKGYCVFRLDDRRPPQADGFSKQKEEIQRRLTRQKQTQVLDNLVAHLRETSDISVEKGFSQ